MTSSRNPFFFSGSRKKGAFVLGIIVLIAIGITAYTKFVGVQDISIFAFERQDESGTFPIELNSADSATLVKLPGIGPYYAKRIIKYRTYLGGFTATTDLDSMYGMKPETLKKIKYKISVDTTGEAFLELRAAKNAKDRMWAERRSKWSKKKWDKKYWKDSFSRKKYPYDSLWWKKKYANDSFPRKKFKYDSNFTFKPRPPVDINTADSAALVKVYGIGPVLSAGIVEYREQLGFFHSLEQLKDVWGMTDENYERLLPEVKLEESWKALPRVRINHLDKEGLAKHPYISYSTAKVIVAYRNEHGMFGKFSDLRKIYGVKKEVWTKLKPYLSFD